MPPYPYGILFVFLDGVGLGPPDPSVNPLAALSLPHLERLAGGQKWTSEAGALTRPDHLFRAVDANLGLEGLPQSGTGQATLFTGVNCAEIAGRHYGPFPHSQTKPAIAAHNVFSRVQALYADDPEPAAFANAYPPRFFTYARQRDRWTVTTRACLDADLRIRTLEDLEAGRALTAEMTGVAWRDQLGFDVEPISETEAGGRFVLIGREHAFTLFEYFLTDKAGHSRSFPRAAETLRAVDAFLGGLIARMDPSERLLVVTSDHGNIEDLSTKSHTRHPVPLVAYGRGAEHFSEVSDLTGVTPAIIDALRAS